MYCVKCGVELADGEPKCPLCGTKVYFPEANTEAKRPYPPYKKPSEKNTHKAICFLITCAYVIAAAVAVVCDINLNFAVTWSDYVVGGLLLSYVMLVLPSWFMHPLPAIFVPCDFVAIGLFLFYVNLRTGGAWYFPFALPVTLGAAIIFSAVSILSYYLKRGKLYIASGAFMGMGVYSVFIEICLHAAFGIHDTLVWSMYPASVLILVGIALMLVAIIRPLREQLYKIFSFEP